MQHSNHKIIVRCGHILIICQIVNIWDQHYMSSDPVLEWHHSRMWLMVWLLGCLIRHCNMTTSNIATILQPRGQEAHQTGAWAQSYKRKNVKLTILPKVWYILDTNDHECDVRICVSKCGLIIGGSMKAEKPFQTRMGQFYTLNPTYCDGS